MSYGKYPSAVSTDISNGLINDNSIRILKGLGADVKGLPLGPITPISTPFLSLADGYGYFTAVYIPQAATKLIFRAKKYYKQELKTLMHENLKNEE